MSGEGSQMSLRGWEGGEAELLTEGGVLLAYDSVEALRAGCQTALCPCMSVPPYTKWSGIAREGSHCDVCFWCQLVEPGEVVP